MAAGTISQQEALNALLSAPPEKDPNYKDILGQLVQKAISEFTSPAVDAEAKAKAPAASQEPKPSAAKSAAPSQLTPADDPEKYIMNTMLVGATPYIAQQGMQFLQQNGKFPDPSVLMPTKVLGQLTSAQMPIGTAQQTGASPDAGGQQEGMPPAPGAAPTPAVAGAGQNGYEADPSKSFGNRYKTVPASSPVGFGGAKIDENGNLVEQKAGFLSTILLGLLGVPSDARAKMDMQKMATAQELLGEKPMQKSERQKSALEVAQKKAEAEQVPLTAEQRATAQAGVTAALTAKEKANMERVDATIKDLQEQYKIISDKAAWTNKGPKLDAIAKQLKYYQEVKRKQMMMSSGRAVTNRADMGHTEAQVNAYNKARAVGMSPEAAKKKAGL